MAHLDWGFRMTIVAPPGRGAAGGCSLVQQEMPGRTEAMVMVMERGAGGGVDRVAVRWVWGRERGDGR